MQLQISKLELLICPSGSEGESLDAEKNTDTITLISVVSLPSSHFMKNCGNREVQPAQSLPPCAQKHVFDECFSLPVP